LDAFSFVIWKDDAAGTPRTGVPLTPAQKRDLMRMAAVGVLSSGLIVAVFIAPRPGVPGPSPAAQTARADTPITIVSVDVLADVSVPVLAPAPAKRTAVRRAGQRPSGVRAAGAAPAPVKLSKRLARFVVGDGQYSVRPFPTVPAVER
jgi:hypothetical protein